MPLEGKVKSPRIKGRAHPRNRSPYSKITLSQTSEYRSGCLQDAGQPRPELRFCRGYRVVNWEQQNAGWPGVRTLNQKLTHSVPRQVPYWQPLRPVKFFFRSLSLTQHSHIINLPWPEYLQGRGTHSLNSLSLQKTGAVAGESPVSHLVPCVLPWVLAL